MCGGPGAGEAHREIATRYERLTAFARYRLSELSATEPGALEDADRTEQVATGRLAMAVRLAAEFTRAMEPDPLLPPELLPRSWPGTRARRLTADCRQRLRRAPSDGPAGLRLFRLYRDTLGDPPEES